MNNDLSIVEISNQTNEGNITPEQSMEASRCAWNHGSQGREGVNLGPSDRPEPKPSILQLQPQMTFASAMGRNDAASNIPLDNAGSLRKPVSPLMSKMMD